MMDRINQRIHDIRFLRTEEIAGYEFGVPMGREKGDVRDCRQLENDTRRAEKIMDIREPFRFDHPSPRIPKTLIVAAEKLITSTRRRFFSYEGYPLLPGGKITNNDMRFILYRTIQNRIEIHEQANPASHVPGHENPFMP